MMRYNYDLSIIVPGTRKEHWVRLYHETEQACKRYSFEFIISGPYVPQPELLERTNVKYLKDFGTPTRAFCLAERISEGSFLTWLSDDSFVQIDSIDLALDLLKSKNPEKDIIGIRYSEGVNHSGPIFPDAYWTTDYHGDFRIPGITRNWMVPGVILIKSSYYRHMGGLDCGFIHLNFNVHLLNIRCQLNGSVIYLSPTNVMNCDFEPNRNTQNSPLIAAYVHNDLPLFKQMISKGENQLPIQIDYENWRRTLPTWERKFV